jgi:hypothetical protein
VAARTPDRPSAISSSALFRRRPVARCGSPEQPYFHVEDGKIAEEVGLDDGVTALQQLRILKVACGG